MRVSCLVVVAGLICGAALAESETLQVNENTAIPAEGAAYGKYEKEENGHQNAKHLRSNTALRKV